jgi:hypothetical protein
VQSDRNRSTRNGKDVKRDRGRYIEEEVLGPPKYFEEALLRELRAQPRDLRAIEVEGQSMEPLVQNGDQVLVDTRKISVVEPDSLSFSMATVLFASGSNGLTIRRRASFG